MKKRKITSLKSLRKQKAALQEEIAQEQAQLTNDLESIVWPLGTFRKFRKASDDMAENKFFVIGVQLAQSVLNAVWKRKKEQEEAEGHGIVEFLKSIAGEFLDSLGKKKETEAGE